MFSFHGPPPHRDRWPELINHLRHRGPDEGSWWADGPFFFGHRRLSIIDLSGGGQPMATADGVLVVIFNGEIYNFVEVRAELEARGHAFRTTSDTEVLLHGYREWGCNLPQHLTGMFAFAVADRRRNELFLARDRFGEKPLFVMKGDDYVAFASEVRALAALPDIPRRMNVDALGGYLALNFVPGSEALLDGVVRLPPAGWRHYTQAGERGGVYWTPPEEPESDMGQSTEEALEEWRARFDRAVEICLRSDVPVGILLSGGMDSSLVAESAARQGRLNKAFLIDFEEASYSEAAAAERVADRLGVPLERTTLRPQVLEDFLQIADHADDPVGDNSCLPVWAVTEMAGRSNKVVLGGDGGDEIFGGYMTYRASRLHGRIVARLPRLVRRAMSRSASWVPINERKVTFSYKLWRFLRAAKLPTGQAHFSWNGAWLPDGAAALIRSGPEREAVRNALPALAERRGLGEPCPLLDLQRADLAEYLPNDILVKVDRMAMAHSLETRAPFLDANLADWALRRPDRLKIGPGGELKTLLRAAARKLFGPEIADRPKQGFSIPIHQWIRGPLRDHVTDLLSRTSVERTGVLDPDRVETILDAHMSKRRSYGFEIWGLAVLMAWHRARVERPPEPPAETPLIERRLPLHAERGPDERRS
jgi:asparagine synthase (glutamine-hydrolysing)